jgi:hypothetical protein
LSYEGYLKLICRYLLNNKYTELINMRILYGDIICVNEKIQLAVI